MVICVLNQSVTLYEKDYPKAASQILKELTPEDNDAIVIAGADSALRAKRGAFAASWSLISA